MSDAAAKTGPTEESHEALAQRARHHFTLGKELGEHGHLAHAVRFYRAALAAVPAAVGDDRADYFVELSDCLVDLNRPDEAIAAAKEGAFVVSPAHPEGGFYILNALMLLFRRYEARGEPADLVDVTDMGSVLLPGIAEGSEARQAALQLLCIAFRRRFEAQDNLPSLGNAIEAADELVRSPAVSNTDRVTHLQALIIARHLRFERTGLTADLDGAVAAARAASKLVGSGDADEATVFSQLSAALVQRFEQLGSHADLDEGIEVGKFATTSADPRDPYRFAMMSNLSRALVTRFEETGAHADIDEAVRLGDLALRLGQADARERALLKINLANALRARFDRTQEIAFLEDADRRATSAVRELGGTADEVVARVSAGHTSLALAELVREGADGWGARRRHRRLLDGAVQMFERAVALTPDGHARLPALLADLCQALLLRFEVTRRSRDLDAAVASGQRSVAIGTPDDRSLAAHRVLLARALAARFRVRNTRGDATEAIIGLRVAATTSTAPTDVRLNAAHDAAKLVVRMGGSWAEALKAYNLAIELLPLLALRGGDFGDNERRLGGWAGLASDAAACAVEAGQAERAIELLEQGRGVLWSSVLDERADLGRLGEVAPELAAEVEAVRTRLDAPDDAARGLSSRREDAGVLDRRWRELVARVRRTPGFADFLAPKEIRDLRPADPGLTVAVINVSRYRCDALLVSSSGVQVVPLPGLSRDEAAEQATKYLDGLSGLRDCQAAFDEVVFPALSRWMWQAVAEPVLKALRPGADLPRICWCPTGPLTLLPVHAAGSREPAGWPGVLDLTISSYTPTLSALRLAPSVKSAGPRSILSVAVPDAPDHVPLPEVANEAKRLKAHHGSRVTELVGPSATRDAVLTGLRRHRWAHFACHGKQDPAEPASGGLVLADGSVLTVADLAKERFEHEFVYLSACDTARSGLGNLDEAVTLVAALQYTGWQSVVGTLWSVVDDVAARVAELVHSSIASEASASPDFAAALRQAVRTIRDAEPDKPSAWAPYVHFGT
ncbi:CHAT domain-containing protein [Amycolatopsis sp. NPDC098790]|uniref:CHAT domain-containing protein n=1 Tax=Amycolatopsis sp. NPDC098790 TaxID=3363939 RepID=UPI00381AB44E